MAAADLIGRHGRSLTAVCVKTAVQTLALVEPVAQPANVRARAFPLWTKTSRSLHQRQASAP